MNRPKKSKLPPIPRSLLNVPWKEDNSMGKLILLCLICILLVRASNHFKNIEQKPFNKIFGLEAGYQSLEERKKVTKAIEEKYTLIKEIRPTHEFTLFYPVFLNNDYKTLQSINPFEPITPGPTIRIYERKK